LQDSAAVQILLEICLPTEEEKAKGINPDSLLRNVQSIITTGTPNMEVEDGEDNLLCNLREVQCLVCCLLHQMYIADPNIAKLVHFQVGF
jgi:integrator complex subunit 2